MTETTSNHDPVAPARGDPLASLVTSKNWMHRVSPALAALPACSVLHLPVIASNRLARAGISTIGELADAIGKGLAHDAPRVSGFKSQMAIAFALKSFSEALDARGNFDRAAYAASRKFPVLPETIPQAGGRAWLETLDEVIRSAIMAAFEDASDCDIFEQCYGLAGKPASTLTAIGGALLPAQCRELIRLRKNRALNMFRNVFMLDDYSACPFYIREEFVAPVRAAGRRLAESNARSLKPSDLADAMPGVFQSPPAGTDGHFRFFCDLFNPAGTRSTPRNPTAAQLCLDILDRENRPLHIGRLHEFMMLLRPKIKRISITCSIRTDARFKKVSLATWGLASWDAARLADFEPPPRPKHTMITGQPTMMQLCFEILGRENRPMRLVHLHKCLAQSRPTVRRNYISGALAKDARFKKVSHGIWGLASWDAARLADFEHPKRPKRDRLAKKPILAQLCLDILTKENRPLHFRHLHECAAQTRPDINPYYLTTALGKDSRFKKVSRSIWGLASWDTARLADFDTARLADFEPPPHPKHTAAPRQPPLAQLCLEILARENRPLHINRLHKCVMQTRPAVRRGSIINLLSKDNRFKKVWLATWGLATWDAARLADFVRLKRPNPAVVLGKPTIVRLCFEILSKENRSMHFRRLHECATQIRPGINPYYLTTALGNDSRFKKVHRSIWGLASWDAARLADFEPPPPVEHRNALANPSMTRLCLDILGRENRPMHLSRLHEHMAQILPAVTLKNTSSVVRSDQRFKNVCRGTWGLASWDAARLADFDPPPPIKRVVVREYPTVEQSCLEILTSENRPMHQSSLAKHVSRLRPAVTGKYINDTLVHDNRFKKVWHATWGLASWDAARLADFERPKRPRRTMMAGKPTVVQSCLEILTRENRPMRLVHLHKCLAQSRPSITYQHMGTVVRISACFKKVRYGVWGLATWDAARLADFERPKRPRHTSRKKPEKTKSANNPAGRDAHQDTPKPTSP